MAMQISLREMWLIGTDVINVSIVPSRMQHASTHVYHYLALADASFISASVIIKTFRQAVVQIFITQFFANSNLCLCLIV